MFTFDFCVNLTLVCLTIGVLMLWRQSQHGLIRAGRVILSLGCFAIGLHLIISEITRDNFESGVTLLYFYTASMCIATLFGVQETDR